MMLGGTRIERRCLLVLLLLLTIKVGNAFHQVSSRQRSVVQSPWQNNHHRSLFSRQQRIQSSLSASFSAAMLASTVDTLIQSSPYTAAAITCGVKASAADFVAQKRQLRKRNEKIPTQTETNTANNTTNNNRTDWKRNLAFLLYGSLYQGMAQEFIYNHVYPTLFGVQTTFSIVVQKVAFDLLIQTTLITLPIAYLTKAMIYKYSWQEALLRRYKDDVWNHGLLKKYYLLWGPVQCLTFSIIPEHYRVTWIACVSFFWLIILSSISSRTKVATAVVKQPVAVMAEGELVDDEMSFTEEELNLSDCELADGLTCNVDG